MGLRLILGRAGSGKSSLCLEEITDELRRSPRGASLIYLVPEQATFQAETTLAGYSPSGGAIRAQALSFRRLAWRVLQETGGHKRLFLDDTGKSMLLQKIMERRQKDLQVFKGVSKQSGATQNLLQFYSELKRSNVTLGRLRALNHAWAMEPPSEESTLHYREKLEDLLFLFGEMEDILENHYLDNEDYLTLLTLKIPASAFLKNAVIWADGFYSFTNQEYSVLVKLLQECSQLNVTLCLDRDCSADEKVDQMDTFYSSALTCNKLRHLSEKKNILVHIEMLPGKRQTRFSSNQALSFLEQHLYNYSTKKYSFSPEKDTIINNPYNKTPLRLVFSTNRRCEVESLARDVLSLVRDRGYRWRDIVVMAGDLEHYRPLIASIFAEYQIPYFLDKERPARNHPLCEFVCSALELVNRRWCYEDIFRCLKTDFPLPLASSKKWRERVDRLENYVLAFGIQGEKWSQKEPWDFRKKDMLDIEKNNRNERLEGESSFSRLNPGEKRYLKLIDATRQRLVTPLLKFHQDIKGISTVREKCLALYQLLLEVEIQPRLESWIKEATEQGSLQEAREHGQVYEGLLGLLDQMVEIMGDEEITTEFFSRLLDAGLDSLYFSLVPPSLDQVLVGNMERTRTSSVKCSFILGVNEGSIPSPSGENEIFTDGEREKLQSWGLDIPPGSRRQLLDEQFLIYVALTRASDELRLSYALADEEGTTLAPSLLITQIKELFPELQEEHLKTEPPILSAADDFSSEALISDGQNNIFPQDKLWTSDEEMHNYATMVLPFVTRPEKTFSQLLLQLNRFQKESEIYPLWWEVYNWYTEQKEWHSYCKKMLESVFYSNTEKSLDKTLSRRLYGDSLQTSISRLEKFSACPFSHFASHGLKLEERQVYSLKLPDLGRFFHAALRDIAFTLQEQKKDWAELSRDQSYKLAAEEVKKLVPFMQEEILLSSGRYRYLTEKIKRTVGRTVYILGEHARRGSFTPVGVEISFGGKGELPAITFTLQNGFAIELEGRIDRVDLAWDEKGEAFIRVIDYKSGGSELDLKEIYYGLSLQLIVYLDVVMTCSKEWLQQNVLPAGMFFFPLYSPLISTTEALAPNEIEEKILKNHKLKGRIMHDARVVRLMDNSLEKGYSSVIPAGLKINDELYEKSSSMVPEQFEQLRRYVRKIIEKIASGITSGRVDISPYRLNNRRSCTHCPYKPVCQFDTLLECNNFRQLQAVEEKQFWSLIEESAGKTAEDHKE